MLVYIAFTKNQYNQESVLGKYYRERHTIVINIDPQHTMYHVVKWIKYTSEISCTMYKYKL